MKEADEIEFAEVVESALVVKFAVGVAAGVFEKESKFLENL